MAAKICEWSVLYGQFLFMPGRKRREERFILGNCWRDLEGCAQLFASENSVSKSSIRCWTRALSVASS